MSRESIRTVSKLQAANREERIFERPTDGRGNYLPVTEYFGENIFHFSESSSIPTQIKNELESVIQSGKGLKKEHAEIVAKAVTEWAIEKGATHFCHWFQPLTGATAEKHDAFLDFDRAGKPIEKLSASQLVQGEPDASSFPNGGSRATFEARGYTAWDLTSPMFLIEGASGKTLCIPTAFVSYHGEALDVKTPLLRSVSKLSEQATKFLNLSGFPNTKSVNVTCGAEQEYFLVDKAFYFARPDLVMAGRALFGAPAVKNQQLEDHYFGAIPERVLCFMEELDYELHRLGIPAKTRHNEVAPGQFEIAQIFRDANVAADQNQLVMATIKNVANRHNFVALLHEKPFAGVNGSGKHLNWSMASDEGLNLLEPGDEIHSNMRFLAVTSIIVEAVKRHAKVLRASIASAGNDHRLGANEAPPSIISVYLGDAIGKIFDAIKDGKATSSESKVMLDLGARQLAMLPKDNTDRNRTSPFAFTGNKFEFRAVGSAMAIGLPMSILNGAVSDIFEESNKILETELAAGKTIDAALMEICKKWISSSHQVIFNGDGYSDEWVQEANRRGLPNLKTTADCLHIINDTKETNFLTRQEIFRASELETRYHVLTERYNTIRLIELHTFIDMIHKFIIPSCLEYKKELGSVIKEQKNLGFQSNVETDLYKEINLSLESLYENARNLKNMINELPEDIDERAKKIAHELMPVCFAMAEYCNQIECLMPEGLWELPSFFDMLYLR
ncbi:glutamine synthetase type III N-terminal domain protein [Bacteriovorax sp. BSW11_IV]|uniref:glutamine synthetase III family protein n=1 Tax=Bacteriovorax sp. BSW11_IV TaxID=1353529 RepID=UPI000389EE9F|nr:glutamine synthetase III [Bacteriovorax sp. BSW11_IV]EQC47814.1 glutamine synthetase type III N-terminal domain protein [Bacteriovorax sp. BSW11_IV]